MNPEPIPASDGLAYPHPDVSILHTPEWAEALCESLRCTQRNIEMTEGAGLKVFLPLMEVRSAFTGNRAVSLPFSDYYDPRIRHMG